MTRGLWLVGAWVVAVALAIGVPWYLTWRAPLAETVLRLGDETFTLGAVARRIGPDGDGLALLERMAADRLILAEARRRGLLPTDAALRQGVLQRVGETSGGMNDAAMRLEAVAARAGIDMDELMARETFRVARQRLGEALAGIGPDGAEMVSVWAAVSQERDEAEAVARAALDSGSLPAVAASMQVPGGALGWLPRGADDSRAEPQWLLDCPDGSVWQAVQGLYARGMVAGSPPPDRGAVVGSCTVRETIPGGLLVDDLAFAMPVGGVSPPLLTEQGLVILQVLDRARRPVPPEMRDSLERTALRRFTDAAIAAARQEGRLELRWGSDQAAFLKLRAGSR